MKGFSYLYLSLTLFASFFTNEPLLFVFKENIKRGESTINTGDVLLKIYLVFIAQCFMSIDLLLHDS